MFKVLIVEDEMFVRLGIRASIDWGKLDMEVIADVENGQAAWEAYEKFKPQLILTDIRMPVMDGIQLIEKIREKDSKTKLIILSCLEEFELVRKALSLGVSDYILKLTMSQGEMEAVLNKVRNELKTDYSSKADNNEGISSDISKETVFFNFLLYGTYTVDQFAEEVSKLKIQLRPERLVLCSMEIDHYEEVQKLFDDEQGRLIRFTFLNVIDELLNKYERGVAFYENNKRYVLLFSFSDISQSERIKETLNEILDHIKRAMKSYINCSVSFGISSTQDGYSSISKIYNESVNAIKCKYFLGMGETIAISMLNVVNIKARAEKKLQNMLESLNILDEKSHNELRLDLEAYLENFNVSKTQMSKLFIRLGHWTLMSMQLNNEGMFDLVTDYTQQIEACETLDEAINRYKDYFKAVADVKTGMKSYSKEVVKVLKLVQENYGNEFSLKRIAEMVEMSPNYLCSLIKKELGIGLNEYLMRYRIEKAKYLLSNTNMKVYEIAIKVGYMDESYFSRSFKKITGVRPNDFKKQWF